MGHCHSKQDVHVHNNIVNVQPASPEETRSRSRSPISSSDKLSTSGELHKSKTSSRKNSSPSDTSLSQSRIFLRPRTNSVSPFNSGSSRSMDSLSPRPKTAGSRLLRNTVSPMDSSSSPPQLSFISPRKRGTSIFVSQTNSPELIAPVQLSTSSTRPKDSSSSHSSSSRQEFNSSSLISISPQPRNTSSPKSKDALSSGDSNFGFISPGSQESGDFPQPDVSSPKPTKKRSSSKKKSSRRGSRRGSAISSVYLDSGQLSADLDSVETACKNVMEKIECNDDKMRECVKSLLVNWEKCNLLEEIKCHARSTSKELSRQIHALASYLTRKDTNYYMKINDSIPGHYSLAKAFAIYFWIGMNISFDNELWKEYITNPSKEDFNIQSWDVLSAGKTFSLGYSSLFREMATHAGIETVMIEGTLCQVPNPALPDNVMRTSAAIRHTWNAVSYFCM